MVELSKYLISEIILYIYVLTLMFQWIRSIPCNKVKPCSSRFKLRYENVNKNSVAASTVHWKRVYQGQVWDETREKGHVFMLREELKHVCLFLRIMQTHFFRIKQKEFLEIQLSNSSF